MHIALRPDLDQRNGEPARLNTASTRGHPMKRTWTIVGVSDVHASVKWYQSLFGQPVTPPTHDYFGQILDTDGTVLLCLHPLVLPRR